MRTTLVLFLFVFHSFCCSAQYKSYKGDGADDILQYVPYASALTMKIAGVDGASSWKRFVVNGGLSFVVSSGITYALKHSIHETRPDGTDNRAFPSGHSSIAFSGATVLHKEYGKVSPLISIAGYGVATFTAIDRIVRHRHEWHDVVAGAGIGILSTKLCYWLGDKLTGERSRFIVAPTQNGVSMLFMF